MNGLGIVRSLAARNVRTAVITTKPFDIAHHSRWISAHDAAPGIEAQSERLADVLERRASEWRGSALFPTNDEAMAAVVEHEERLSASYRIIAPPPEVTRCLLDKQRMLDVARATGVDTPNCYGQATEATAALPELRFPVVVKPVVGYRFASVFGSKLLVADDRAELRRCVALVAGARIPCHVSDLIPGGDHRIYSYCTYLDATGEPVGGLTVRKLRQSPPFYGVARVAEIGADHSSMREAAIEILRRMGLHGMAVVEFKLDPRDGRFRFLEVNGRSILYNGLLRRAGLDLAWTAWSDYMLGTRAPARPNGWPGVWIHLHADLLYSTLYRRHDPIRLAEFLAPYARPKVFAVWSGRDPSPFLAQWRRTLREVASGMPRHRHRERLADHTRVTARS